MTETYIPTDPVVTLTEICQCDLPVIVGANHKGQLCQCGGIV